MATHLTREELKRNELGEAVEKGFHFAEHHLKAIVAGVAGLLGLVVIVWAIVAWRGGVAERANVALGEALDLAEAPVVATGAQPDDAKEPTFATEAARDARAKAEFEKVVSEYGGTAAGGTARLWLADRAFAAGDRAEARRLWREFLAGGGDGMLAAAAQHDLWTLDRSEGKAEAVLAEVRRALEAARGPLPADALLWELAETERALGHDAEASAALKRILDEHPDSAYASAARERRAEGAGTP